MPSSPGSVEESEPLVAKRRRIEPSLISANPQSRNFSHWNRDDYLASQSAEAEHHQFQVDNGLCWLEDYYGHPFLEPSALADSNLPPDAMSLLSWSGPQKATFIELIGRKTPAALPEISKIVGKSLIECQAYLELLQQNSGDYVIDYAEIPAAEEVPLHLVEPDLDGYLLNSSHSGKANTKRTLDCNLVSSKRLASFTGKKISPELLSAVCEAIRSRVSLWVETLLKQCDWGNCAPKISVEEVKHVVRINEEDSSRLFGISTWERDNPPTAYKEILEQQAGLDQDSDSTDTEKEDEEDLTKLLDDEEAWLEELDRLKSKFALVARRLEPSPAKFDSLMPRYPALERRMRSR